MIITKNNAILIANNTGKLMKYSVLFVLALPFFHDTCQKPLTSYLQLLPADLLRNQINYILSSKPVWQSSAKPLWKADQEITRVERAIQLSTAFQQICSINLNQTIIDRMRADLATRHAQEEFYSKEVTLFIESWNGGDFPTNIPCQPFDSSDNPKHFQFLMPLKALLAYSKIDQEWLKEFIMSKKSGGTLRKHLFINALEHQDEYWANYLWNNKYRKQTIAGNIRNMPFLRMALGTANHTKYVSIHEVLKKAYDERMARMKAAQTWHPG